MITLTSSWPDSVSSCSGPATFGGTSNQLIPNACTPSSRRTNRTAPPRTGRVDVVDVDHAVTHALSLHPEDTERRLGNRRVERGRDAERKHTSRVERVDDAVVPEPRGRMVRIPLALVLRADL